MSDGYAFLRLGNPSGDWQELAAWLTERAQSEWASQGAATLGLFYGLFGMQSNELIVVLHNPREASLQALIESARPAAVVRAARLRATARPQAFAPLRRPGLYVFRNFRLQVGALDDTVQLSRQAWETFEQAPDYQAEPIGLFEELDVPAGGENLMLLTWYDGFGSWESSRRPPPAAWENFRQRRALVTRTGALATQLVDIAGT